MGTAKGQGRPRGLVPPVTATGAPHSSLKNLAGVFAVWVFSTLTFTTLTSLGLIYAYNIALYLVSVPAGFAAYTWALWRQVRRER
ncbi:MAG: hypothetical protein Kow0069_33340 [Promethearchaeota archaeon]